MTKFHDQSIAKLDLLKIKKMLKSSKFRFVGQYSDVVVPHSHVKGHLTYIYSKRTFYWLSYIGKTRKTFLVLEK